MASKSSRIIDGLKTNTPYYFHVRAKNTIGKWSELSDVVSNTTIKDTTAPTAPTNFIFITIPNFFLFNWTKNPEVDMRGGGYKLYVYTSNDSANAKLIKEIGYTSEWAIVSLGEKSNDASITLLSGVSYWWWLSTIDASANESAKLASTPTNGYTISEIFLPLANKAPADNQIVPASYSCYITDEYEIVNTYYLEISNYGTFEIG